MSRTCCLLGRRNGDTRTASIVAVFGSRGWTNILCIGTLFLQKAQEAAGGMCSPFCIWKENSELLCMN